MNAQGRASMRSGFTLIEVVIILLIIAILSTIGVYSYRGMINKARMTQAKVVLKHMFQAQVTYFSDKGIYSDNLVILDYDPVRFNFYTVSVILDNGGKDFVGTATGIGPMKGDQWTITREGSPIQADNSVFK